MTASSQGHTAGVPRAQTWRTVENSATYLAPYLAPGMRVLERARANAWRSWADHPDGWFAVPHGEVIVRTSA